MYWIGVDHHKRTTYVTSLAADGTRRWRGNLSADRATLAAFLAAHPRPFTLGIEACYAWEYVVDLVEAMGETARVGHPLLLKAFARGQAKNDRIDSALCARLLVEGHFPAIRHPSKRAREQRDLYRQRMELVAKRSSAAARAKAFADRLGYQTEMNLSTQKGIAALAALPVSTAERPVMQSHRRYLRYLYGEIHRLEKEIDRVAQRSEEAQWLDTVPGIAAYFSLLVSSEVFDVTRFANGGRFVGYSGLGAAVCASGGRVYASHLPAGVNKYLRWAFCEAADHYRRAVPALDRKYQRLKIAKGWKTARLAVARHLALVCYHILKEKRPYLPVGAHNNNNNDNNG